MSYVYILERIEAGRYTVDQAMKEIEKEAKRQQKKAKKIKILIIDDGRKISIPSVPFGMMHVFLNLCAPFIKLDQQHEESFSSDDKKIMVHHLSHILKLMKEYPPFEMIHVESKETIVKILTK